MISVQFNKLRMRMVNVSNHHFYHANFQKFIKQLFNESSRALHPSQKSLLLKHFRRRHYGFTTGSSAGFTGVGGLSPALFAGLSTSVRFTQSRKFWLDL